MSAPTSLESLRQIGQDRFGNAFLVENDRPELPSWFDRVKFESGREFFRQHVLSIAFSYFCSLYVGFTVESLAKAVSFTGESDTADRSRHRYLNTMSHLFSWHTSDIVCDESSIGYRSLRYVRVWHDRVRNRMAKASDKDMEKYVTQYDTALVQTGFVGPMIMYPRQFGIRCKKDESDMSNYVYFWRVIGYIIGLYDDVNACGLDLVTTRRIAKQIEQEIIVPGLLSPNGRFQQLSQALIKGFQVFWPWMNNSVIRGFVFPLMGLPMPKEMSWKDYFVVKLLNLHFFLMYYVPWYSTYWNRNVFRLMEKVLPPAVLT